MIYHTTIDFYPDHHIMEDLPVVLEFDPCWIERDPSCGVMFGYTEAANPTIKSAKVGNLTLTRAQLVEMSDEKTIAAAEERIADQIEAEFAAGDLEAA